MPSGETACTRLHRTRGSGACGTATARPRGAPAPAMPSSSSTARSVPDVPDVRWGLTVPFAGVALRDHRPLLELAEAEGFEDLWTGEATGVDGFTPLALAAAWTTSPRLATG